VGFIGGALGVRILTWLSPTGENSNLDGSAYNNKSKLEVLFGPTFFDELRGRVVLDFGCGAGEETMEMARRGAARVIGLDIRPKMLAKATARAEAAGLADRCTFTTSPIEPADVIVSLDCFEHYEDPAAVLQAMETFLKPGGKVLVSFGGTWYHPYGGHLFALFPWAHLLFTEYAMLTWRKQSHPTQTARTIKECGLNKMTLRRFERLVEASPFTFAAYEARPIRAARRLWNPLTREFFTSVIQCTLVRKSDAALAVAA
jgi:2-polyprenyl-3-methyl-5-hydroxy-6-metoxy-1,4-benzoquinol methylase